MAMLNLVFIFLVVKWLPDWTMKNYLQALLKCTIGAIQHLQKVATSIAIIVAFCFAVAFKDRIAQLLGFDHATLFRFKVRDCLTCLCPNRFQPIEISAWKVEDLVAADPFSANNIFVEFFLGYNEPMKTRVHNNAGSECHIKERIQLNFDEDDEEETLYIFVRNQNIVGNSELARAELSTQKLKGIVREAATRGEFVRWSPEFFGDPIPLIPRGRLWMRAAPLMDDELKPSFFNDMTAC